mgnify:CR=1 FL=1
MTATIILGIGLEYIDTVFQAIQASDFSQYTIAGMKTLAVLFFLVNILKKYNEGIADKDGYTWGLSPGELAKNFAIVLLVIFSTQVLGFFDGILVAIEGQYRGTAPALLPLQMQDIPLEEDVSLFDAASSAMTLLYEALVTPLYGFKILAFILSTILWILDLFIYPLFLAERFFLLGIMQAFFPLVISLAVFEKFRSLAYTFFKLYAAVYMLVPAFFLVNVFINAIYTEINTNFWVNLFGTDTGQGFFAPVVQLGSVGFIVFLKFKLYRPYKNIYNVLKLNRFIVLAVVVCALLSSTFSVWMVFNTNQKALNSAFAINTDGSIIPLKLVTQKENFRVEALAHLELFHNYFYNIDASNYERNLEKALWLGNSSVDNLYRQKKADGVYNRLLQYSLVQKVLSIDSKISESNGTYSFTTTTIFEINRGSIIDTYELVSTGNLITVDRNFPNNPHGLLITNYFENTLKKLNDES